MLEPRHAQTLLEVWNEAGRHIELEASFPAIGRILGEALGLDRMVVVVLERTTPRIHAEWREARGARAIGASRSTDLPPLEALSRVGKARRSGSAADVTRLEERGSGREWWAVPLTSAHLEAPVLLLRPKHGGTLTPGRERFVGALAQPFSAALEHDARFRELETLREAAEAERRSALSRLGREELVDTVVGAGRGLRLVMERVELVGPSDVPVLILGESGSGKEVIARAIHERSPRRHGPFVRVNCGAMPSELVDSELFGHEKGAFTGATSMRRGWFERAHRGTLLLDEVGELPLPAQVRLLRVLQEGTFERVGGETTVSVDVRIVAATHRDLPAMVQEGRFREDLWYRISGFPLLLPPLRERREDIPELANHFALRAARRFGLRPQTLREEDVELLLSYDWPGNIRELQSVIDRAAILGGGQRLAVEAALRGGLSARPDKGRVDAPAPRQASIPSLADGMRAHIERALRATNGRIEGSGGAAEILEINPNTLRARMRRLGIRWETFRTPKASRSAR